MNGEQTIKKPAIRSLHIEGRRWFRKSAGTTYTSVYVYVNGECMYKGGPENAYGDHYITMAMEGLIKLGYVSDTKEAKHAGTLYVRETLGGSYSVIDVGREKDL